MEESISLINKTNNSIYNNTNYKNNSNNNNTLNYFKIYSLLNNICATILVNIFKSRWESESKGEPWINNCGYGVLLIGRLSNYDTEFSDTEKSIINCNNLEDWDIGLLSSVLQNFKYLNIDKDTIDTQNNYISNIKINYLKVIKLKELKEYSFRDENEYYAILKELKKSIMVLDPLNPINKFDINDNELIFQVGSINENSVSEKQAKKYKDLGNIEYRLRHQFGGSSNNPYLKAIEYYDMGLQQIGISNLTKSTLYNNKSLCYIELFNKLLVLNQNSHHDISGKDSNSNQSINKYIVLGIENAINSILAHPLNYKSYFKLGQSLLISNDYINALNCFKVSLNFGNPSNKESSELIEIISKITNFINNNKINQ